MRIARISRGKTATNTIHVDVYLLFFTTPSVDFPRTSCDYDDVELLSVNRATWRVWHVNLLWLLKRFLMDLKEGKWDFCDRLRDFLDFESFYVIFSKYSNKKQIVHYSPLFTFQSSSSTTGLLQFQYFFIPFDCFSCSIDYLLGTSNSRSIQQGIEEILNKTHKKRWQKVFHVGHNL